VYVEFAVRVARVNGGCVGPHKLVVAVVTDSNDQFPVGANGLLEKLSVRVVDAKVDCAASDATAIQDEPTMTLEK